MNTSRKTVLTEPLFREITAADFSRLVHYMELTDSRTCDYTLGGVVLWADYFDYRIAENDDTLFISGAREDNLSVPAYSLPLGGGSVEDAIEQMRDWADGERIWLSAIPEDRLHLFATLGGQVMPLGPEWSDYLYDIRQFATLGGNVMKKKRNHVNKFMAEHPDYKVEEMTAESARECLALLAAIGNDGSPTGRAEQLAVGRMLIRWSQYAPYLRGLVLRAEGRVVGFTVGEVKFDTLHVHVEKADHSVSGSNEMLAHSFAARMLDLYPRLLYSNRQDDAGDPGLRAAKESWHPLRLLPKFNVRI